MLLIILAIAASAAFGQDDYQIRTIFKSGHKASGGYVAVSNKFTNLGDDYANMVELYGGWFVNHKFLLGLQVAALTNNIRVPQEFSSLPDEDMSYQFGQFGLMTEYTLWSHRAIHLSFHAMGGAGFTVQYPRHSWEDDDHWVDDNGYPHDTNWFTVVEPGIKVEMNVFKWMRFSPGISYRAAFDSKAAGLSDDDLSGMSLNMTLKFGKF
jgi:hypothetical protein